MGHSEGHTKSARVFRAQDIFARPNLVGEPRRFVWAVLTQKCWLGARADGSYEPEWSELIPPERDKPVVRDAKDLPYFEMCDWLAEDSLEDAELVFGGKVSHVWQMLDRSTLRSPQMRRAVRNWLASMPDTKRSRLMEREPYRAMMKALRGRWPDRGAGSACRPIHMSEEELNSEVARILTEVAIEVLPRLGEHSNASIDLIVTLSVHI